MNGVEREAARVAAAFGVQEWESDSKVQCSYESLTPSAPVLWELDPATGALSSLFVGDAEPLCMLLDSSWYQRSPPTVDDQWVLIPSPDYHAVMARGLYRLGFEEPRILAELNSPLSEHEKLELRLSMPREFWPAKWLVEGDL